MESLLNLRNTCEDFSVEFDIQPAVDVSNISNKQEKQIIQGLVSVDEQLDVIEKKLVCLNKDIDRLTNHSDGIDYSSAVICGLIAGIIDSIVVGEWDFGKVKGETYKEINSKVISFAKNNPEYEKYCNFALEGKGSARRKLKDPDRLDSAVEFLEWKYHLPGDGAYRTGKFGIDGNTHRIDDFCHHPTIVGLISCVIVQFTGSTLYVNKFGEDINIPIAINEYGNFVGNNTVTKMFAGVINWFICCAKTIDNRKGHLMSDISTSASLPGSVLSIITEIASIPGFRNEEFLINLRKAYMHGIGTEKGIDLGVFNQLFAGAESKIDAITEKAVLHEVKRQTLPVIINEVLVRGVYFVRRLVGEIIEKKDVMRIEWKKVIPYNNRTTTRMLTIATGTFTAVDMADAAVRASMKSVDLTTMMSNMILRVNFVGIGRFAIAVSVDLGMGVSKNVKRHSRIKIQEQELLLLNAKIEYKNAGMWKAAEQASETIEEAYEMAEEAAEEYKNTVVSVSSSLNNIGTMVPGIKEKNPSLVDEITDILEW